MEGISKETLLKLLGNRDPIPDARSVRILQGLIADCKELDPWLPIESCPWDHRVMLFWPSNKLFSKRIEIRIYDIPPEDRKPTHWKELPLDPK